MRLMCLGLAPLPSANPSLRPVPVPHRLGDPVDRLSAAHASRTRVEMSSALRACAPALLSRVARLAVHLSFLDAAAAHARRPRRLAPVPRCLSNSRSIHLASPSITHGQVASATASRHVDARLRLLLEPRRPPNSPPDARTHWAVQDALASAASSPVRISLNEGVRRLLRIAPEPEDARRGCAPAARREQPQSSPRPHTRRTRPLPASSLPCPARVALSSSLDPPRGAVGLAWDRRTDDWGDARSAHLSGRMTRSICAVPLSSNVGGSGGLATLVAGRTIPTICSGARELCREGCLSRKDVSGALDLCAPNCSYVSQSSGSAVPVFADCARLALAVYAVSRLTGCSLSCIDAIYSTH
ncbi:hypothetical protein OH77DRAFT_783554 [Trametes cingulata]|nr:hypothetical protein OH77DRAFT_783554 [Trametes cingulata]